MKNWTDWFLRQETGLQVIIGIGFLMLVIFIIQKIF